MKKMTKTIRDDLTQTELDTIAVQMDDEIRERLHARGLDSPAAFLRAYLAEAPDFADLLDSSVWA